MIIHLADNELLDLVAAGSQRAFAVLFSRKLPHLLDQAVAAGADKDRAADVVRRSVFELWTTAPQRRGRAHDVDRLLADNLRSRILPETAPEPAPESPPDIFWETAAPDDQGAVAGPADVPPAIAQSAGVPEEGRAVAFSDQDVADLAHAILAGIAAVPQIRFKGLLLPRPWQQSAG
jgi:hypothetical protein